MAHHQGEGSLSIRSQSAEYRFCVFGERAFQFPQFAIIRPPEQAISPGTLLVVEQRQNMLEQRQRFWCGQGCLSQCVIKALTRLLVLLELQTSCFGWYPDHVADLGRRGRPQVEFSAWL